MQIYIHNVAFFYVDPSDESEGRSYTCSITLFSFFLSLAR